jgi:cysteinyl-tRNA synthetase
MLKLYNSLTRKKEEFIPIKKGLAKIYNCGPTVYDFAHLGNLRRFINADLLRRTLEYFGYQVRQVTNITDVGHLTDDEEEDKVVKKAAEENKNPYEIAKFYEEAFFRDLQKLNVEIDKEKREHYPRATENISVMIDIIEKLLEKGLAYKTPNGVYFDITRAKDYGKLSGNRFESLEAGKRVAVDRLKRHPADFALWIVAQKEHLMQWDSPWGWGYPGWHIECSAMTFGILGKKIDIHTGGVDNKFPHHENEIAQSEGFTGEKHVNYWVHNAHLLVNGEKMSKSLGNFYTLEDLEKKGFNPLVFRFLVLSTHYRNTIDFNWKEMETARENLEGFQRLVKRLRGVEKGLEGKKSKGVNLTLFEDNFKKALEDDLNTPLALSHLYEFQKEINKRLDQSGLESLKSEEILSFLRKADQVLGLDLVLDDEEATKEIEKLLQKRENLREEKKFKESDEIRRKIEKKGYLIEDTKEGVRILKK